MNALTAQPDLTAQNTHTRILDLATLSKKMTGLMRVTLAVDLKGDSVLYVRPVKPDGTPRNEYRADETAEYGPPYSVNGKAYGESFEVTGRFMDGAVYLSNGYGGFLTDAARAALLAVLAPVLAEMRADADTLADLNRSVSESPAETGRAIAVNLPLVSQVLGTYAQVLAQVAADADAGTLRAGVPAVELFGHLHNGDMYGREGTAHTYEAQQQLIRDTLTPGTVFLVNGAIVGRVGLDRQRIGDEICNTYRVGDLRGILNSLSSLNPRDWAHTHASATLYKSGALRIAYHLNGEG